MEVLEAIAESIHTTEITRQYLLNAAIKLQERFAKLVSPSLLSSLCRVIAYIRMRMQWKVSRNWFSSIRVVRVSKSKHALSSTPPLVLSHPWIGFSFACLALLIPRSLILARLQLSPSLSALNKDRLELSDNSESPATPSLPAPAATSSQVCLHPPCSPLTLAFIAW